MFKYQPKKVVEIPPIEFNRSVQRQYKTSVINEYGDRLVAEAAAAGQLEHVEFFVEKGASINSEALYNACKSGNIEMVDYMLGKGADPNSDGCLSISLELYNQDIFQALIRKGADINNVSSLLQLDFYLQCI